MSPGQGYTMKPSRCISVDSRAERTHVLLHVDFRPNHPAEHLY